MIQLMNLVPEKNATIVSGHVAIEINQPRNIKQQTTTMAIIARSSFILPRGSQAQTRTANPSRYIWIPA